MIKLRHSVVFINADLVRAGADTVEQKYQDIRSRDLAKKFVKLPQCAECDVKDKICADEHGHGPDSCPTTNLDSVVKESLVEYQKPEIKEFALYATIQERECYANRGKQHPYIVYPAKTRIQETIEFANKLEFKRLGIAFCGGLRREARVLSEILKEQGFEVASVICMVGRTRKSFLVLEKIKR